MVRTDEYEARFQAIISAWLPPEDDMHGETVLLIDGNKRYIRKDGLVCVTIVKAKDGTSAIDAMDLQANLKHTKQHFSYSSQ